ncbi:hypothetical protein F9L07_28420 [Pimelobacter simplex]|uniref:Uncharacterized protein n=1 Tax=Nocardioides simplex TaxID=2045 RepID=A0A7J5DQV3_NOCSI|nr:hypothetical protein [Pimelobacter simplex]KAB2806960.1 hypothetical protein F9L07_28420 [Pimelobacter simplex]
MTTPHQRPALDVLAELRRGRLQNELTEGLHDLIAACTETGRKGELLLKLTVDPKKVGDHETPRIEISDQVVVKRPRRLTAPSIFYVSDDGNAVRNDPNQEELGGLRGLPSDAGADTGFRDGRSAAANDR